jgi:hypothetical protein
LTASIIAAHGAAAAIPIGNPEGKSMTSTAPFRLRVLVVLVILPFALGCGTSNAERPYADAGSNPGAGGTIDVRGSGGETGGAAGGPVPSAAGGAWGATSDAADTTPEVAPGGDGPPADAGAPTDPAAACIPMAVPACDAPPPPPPPRRAWHAFTSAVVAATGARHRGHDLFITPGAPQWLIARFAYGLLDAALPGEEVDVFLLRGCGSDWESLGTAIMTGSGEHPEVEGVPDPGGRVYFPVPASKQLGPGRHRVRFVVAGDGSSAEAFIEVRARGTALAVVDVDGTLTTSESAEFGALLTGQLPTPQPDAARALGLLATRGFRPLYLTARPEWLTERTREFLASNGFPAGIIETTTGGSGALGAAATKFKTDALARLDGKGLVPALAIGNNGADADAYAAANIQPAHSRIFVQFTDSAHGGRRIEAYADVLDDFGRLAPPPCP